MTIDIRALSDFVHCSLNMTKGQEKPVADQVAKDLCGAGLTEYVTDDVAEKAAPVLSNKMARIPKNKASAAVKADNVLPVEEAAKSADVCTDATGAASQLPPNPADEKLPVDTAGTSEV